MATLSQVHATFQQAVEDALADTIVGGGATATVSGTVTTGDVCSIICTSAKIATSPVTVDYTVLAGDTLADIALGLAIAINADPVLDSAAVAVGAFSQDATLIISAPISLSATFSATVTGTSPTEAIAVVPGQAPIVAIAWPSVNTLQRNVSQNGNAEVTVYDQKVVRNSTRWNPTVSGVTATPSTLTSTVSNGTIDAGGSVTITLGGSVTPNDAVSCVLRNFATVPAGSWAAVASGGDTDTPTTVATALAAAINTDPILTLWVSAVAVGPVITLTSKNTLGAISVESYTGNGGTQTREIGRRNRGLIIVQWTRTEEDRIAVGDQIEALLMNLNNNFGVTFPDGTMGRVVMGADYYRETDTLQDVYRRDFLFMVDYPVTTQDQLYSVLAPVLQYQLGQ